MDPHYLPAADHQTGLLVHLMEECSEVIKAAAKIHRFGIDNVHPVPGPSNREKLKAELDDLENAMGRVRTFLGLRELDEPIDAPPFELPEMIEYDCGAVGVWTGEFNCPSHGNENGKVK